jgi:hypothetical protein
MKNKPRRGAGNAANKAKNDGCAPNVDHNCAKSKKKQVSLLRRISDKARSLLTKCYTAKHYRAPGAYLWLATVIRLFFFRDGRPVIRPRFIELSHWDIIKALPATEQGRALRDKWLDKEGKIRRSYWRVVAEVTARDRAFGRYREADPKEHQEAVCFLRFQPDQRGENKEEGGQWARNIYTLSPAALALLQDHLGKVDDLEKFLDLGPGDKKEKNRAPRERPGRDRHYKQEPVWLEEEQARQAEQEEERALQLAAKEASQEAERQAEQLAAKEASQEAERQAEQLAAKLAEQMALEQAKKDKERRSNYPPPRARAEQLEQSTGGAVDPGAGFSTPVQRPVENLKKFEPTDCQKEHSTDLLPSVVDLQERVPPNPPPSPQGSQADQQRSDRLQRMPGGAPGSRLDGGEGIALGGGKAQGSCQADPGKAPGRPPAAVDEEEQGGGSDAIAEQIESCGAPPDIALGALRLLNLSRRARGEKIEKKGEAEPQEVFPWSRE